MKPEGGENEVIGDMSRDLLPTGNGNLVKRMGKDHAGVSEQFLPRKKIRKVLWPT